MTTSLKALPTGTVLTDKCGRHWKLGAVQSKDDQGILYEGTLCLRVGVGRYDVGLGQAVVQPRQGEGNPFLRMTTEAISQLQTCL